MLREGEEGRKERNGRQYRENEEGMEGRPWVMSTACHLTPFSHSSCYPLILSPTPFILFLFLIISFFLFSLFILLSLIPASCSSFKFLFIVFPFIFSFLFCVLKTNEGIRKESKGKERMGEQYILDRFLVMGEKAHMKRRKGERKK